MPTPVVKVEDITVVDSAWH